PDRVEALARAAAPALAGAALGVVPFVADDAARSHRKHAGHPRAGYKGCLPGLRKVTAIAPSGSIGGAPEKNPPRGGGAGRRGRGGIGGGAPPGLGGIPGGGIGRLATPGAAGAGTPGRPGAPGRGGTTPLRPPLAARSCCTRANACWAFARLRLGSTKPSTKM